MTRVIGALGIVTASFFMAAIYSEIRASRIDREAEQLEANALPSVEHTVAARGALWRLHAAFHEYVEGEGDERLTADAAMQAARETIASELALEFATASYAGELELEASARTELAEVDRLLAELRDAARDDTERASAVRKFRRAFQQTDTALERLMSLNAREGMVEVARISTIRAESVRLMLMINLACVALSVLAAVLALRSLRRQRSIERAYEDLLETRATELERFALRTAHDLLGPLSALFFTLSSLKRNSERGLPVTDGIERAVACLKRSQSLVEGIMAFARSGGAAPGGRAHLRATVDGAIDEARTDAEGVQFAVEGFDEEVVVACSSGVLVSVVSNLVRNAVKYLEDQPEKRVSVRASVRGQAVRVEVEDTGPGLPPGLKEHVFEPYVRAPNNDKPGLGLGLATVRRFVEAHGGQVGVDASPQRGCIFWFELPRAAPASGG